MEKTFRVGNNEFSGLFIYLHDTFSLFDFQCDFSLSFSLCYPVHSTNVYGFTYRIKIFITQTYKSTYFFSSLHDYFKLYTIMNTKCPNKSQNLVETQFITIMSNWNFDYFFRNFYFRNPKIAYSSTKRRRRSIKEVNFENCPIKVDLIPTWLVSSDFGVWAFLREL